MMSSIDGRLLVDHWTEHVDSSGHMHIMCTYEAVAKRLGRDAFLIGRASMAEFEEVGTGNTHVAVRKVRSSYRAAGATGIWAVVLDPKGRLVYRGPRVDDAPIVCLLSETVTDDYLSKLEEQGISYAFAGEDGYDIEAALAELSDTFGIRRLLLEGGAITNGHFLRAGLIDEMSLVIYPGVDGESGHPAIFESEDPFLRRRNTRVLRYLASEVLQDGFVWLRYAWVDCPDE